MRTIFRAPGPLRGAGLPRQLAAACLRALAPRSGPVSLVLYDVTTLHFEVENEDELRKVGMSKERRVDPQIQVGLLVDPSGFPLEVCCFEGNKAETKTLLPVLTAFAERHQVRDMVVVADAGMLSAANLNAIEDAGFSLHRRVADQQGSLRPGRRTSNGTATRSPTGRSSNHPGSWAPGRPPGRGGWSTSTLFARHKRDDRAINAMVDRAEKVAAGTRR